MKLNLAEEFVLLALNDETGKWVAEGTALQLAIPGALLIELFQLNKLTMDNKKVIVLDSTPTGDAQLDEALNLITSAKKTRKPNYWVQKLASKMKKLKEIMVNRLVEKNIVKVEEDKVLWLFDVKHYPTENPMPELEIRQKLDSIILQGSQPDDHMAALISLAYTCNLAKELFDKEVRKEATKRMKQIAKETKAAEPVAQAIQEVQAAVIASVAAAVSSAAAASASS